MTCDVVENSPTKNKKGGINNTLNVSYKKRSYRVGFYNIKAIICNAFQ